MIINYKTLLQFFTAFIILFNLNNPLWAQKIPSDLMDNCLQWKITYPTGQEEKQLCDEPNNEYFFVNETEDAIVFRTPIRLDNGTTPNSDNIRSELREREADGSVDIYWTTEGSHMLYVEQAITHLPINKPELVASQIHGNKEAGIDDSMVMRLEESHLFLSFNGGKLRKNITIKEDYVLGTKHEVIFLVVNGKHYCYYAEDGKLLEAYNNNDASQYLIRDIENDNDYVMDLNYEDSYFKVGNYTQSNSKEEGYDVNNPENYGEVLVYDFTVVHDEVLVSGVTLTPSHVNLSIGGPFQLTKTITPANATNKSVTYTSSNTAVVEVNENGVLTGIAEGSATVTATTVEGGFTDTITVDVVGNPVGDNLALNKPVTGTGTHDADNVVENLVDGSTSTRWSVSGFPQTAIIDLGQQYSLHRSEVVCYTDRAYQYSIAVSDTENGTYTEIVDRTENVTPGDAANPIVDLFSAVDGRFIKLTVTGAAVYDGPWVSLSEFRIYGESSLSIDDNTSDVTNITLSPNPTSDIVNISGAEMYNTLQVYDQLGKLVMQRTITDGAINISHLSSGLYIFRLSGASQSINKRVIKK
ncbi:alginate lyase (PL7) [Formosa agariphila KMM 3901]|uniref:Alginate lyase (PL7) n=1 Tax=Formosa agariphila (strain DSM 15362 / KCTC 12365 / LMG 23005 / KMM 3901 / M-2Alg 35-1) TaxID=1347342 RepID=T2KKW4_FORAG|nr:polysaccharide lyase family 7 protein [Formosa agariphila]CDF79083.1 alginate lyase (PL7) [Formosa agariphila KMM 3901]